MCIFTIRLLSSQQLMYFFFNFSFFFFILFFFLLFFLLTFYPILIYQFFKDHNGNKATWM